MSARDAAKNKKKTSDKKSRAERRKTPFASLLLNVGSKQNITPARLIGLINNALDSSDATIGKIDIGKNGTLFELDAGVASQLQQAVNGVSYNGVALKLEASPVSPDTGFGKKQQKKKFGKKKKRKYRK